MRAVLVFGLVMGLATPSLAQPSSVRPMPRPDHLGAPPPQTAPPQTAASAVAVPDPMGRVKPRPRPDSRAQQAAVQTIALSGMRSVRPLPRPADAPSAVRKGGFLGGLFARPAAMRPPPEGPSSLQGAVCADPSIRGETLAPILGKSDGCGIAEPVRISEIEGVRLSVAATMDCSTAKALKSWVVKGLQPSFSRDPVVRIKVAAHYACRPRNGRKGAKISEHGKGKAIDIAGVQLASGRLLTVLEGYSSGQGAPLRAAHKAACGVFGTTLGPGSDGFHENHLHFDTARHRNGPYCR